MVTIVKLRQLPGLATLGLLAALLAHEGIFGNQHVAGGIYHAALILTALAGSGSLVVLATALAAAGAGRMVNGSVLAAALRPILPSGPAVLASAACWFAAIERLEPRHAESPALFVLTALILASAVVMAIARGTVEQIAEIVLHCTRATHRKRSRFVHFSFAPPPSARAVAFAYRRFARPPPRS
jgi:hypothetical protein